MSLIAMWVTRRFLLATTTGMYQGKAVPWTAMLLKLLFVRMEEAIGDPHFHSTKVSGTKEKDQTIVQ
jgi:hypothetical protein